MIKNIVESLKKHGLDYDAKLTVEYKDGSLFYEVDLFQDILVLMECHEDKVFIVAKQFGSIFMVSESEELSDKDGYLSSIVDLILSKYKDSI